MTKVDPAANLQALPVPESIATPTAEQVVLTYSNPVNADYQSFGDQLIVQKKQWQSVTKPSTYVLSGASAIGSGPYLLDSFNPQDVKYKANPNYWKQSVSVPEISVPLYSSATSAEVALEQGKIDLAGNDFSDILTAFVDTDTVHHHLFQTTAPYFPASTR